jgi:hypothetical protein
LNKELESGPLHTNLDALHFPSDIQSGLNALATALNATFVFYAIGITAAGLVILISIGCFLTSSPILTLINIFLSSLSSFTILLSSIIITVVQKKGTNLVNKFGKEVGLEAEKGMKFLTMTWVAFAFMTVTALVCVGELITTRRARGREFSEKSQRGGWFGGNRRRSDEAALRRSGV